MVWVHGEIRRARVHVRTAGIGMLGAMGRVTSISPRSMTAGGIRLRWTTCIIWWRRGGGLGKNEGGEGQGELG